MWPILSVIQTCKMSMSSITLSPTLMIDVDKWMQNIRHKALTSVDRVELYSVHRGFVRDPGSSSVADISYEAERSHSLFIRERLKAWIMLPDSNASPSAARPRAITVIPCARQTRSAADAASERKDVLTATTVLRSNRKLVTSVVSPCFPFRRKFAHAITEPTRWIP